MRACALAWLALAVLASSAAAVDGEDDRATPGRFGVRADAIEVSAARREATKRFRLPNASFAEVAAGRPLHYRAADGRWRASAAALSARGADRVAERLPFAVVASGEGIAFGARGEGSGMVLLTEARPSANGQTLGGRPRRGGLGWEWTVTPTELKLSSAPIARSRGASRYAFPFRLWGDFPLFTIDAAGQLSNGRWVFGRPIALGADGVPYPVARWEVGPQELALVVDDRTLPAAAYPYYIDPAIGPYSATQAANALYSPFVGFTKTWDDPQRALTNNNAKAKVLDLAPGVDVTAGLAISGFGFNVAPLAVITGVEVALDRSTGGCGGCVAEQDCIVEDRVHLSLDGTSVVGENRAGTACWPLTSNTLQVFGGPTDTWGAALTPAAVNAPTFGPVVSARAVSAHGSNLPDAEMDFVSITVYWRQPDPPPGTLLPSADTFVRGGAPDTNEGLNTMLRVRESEDNRALVRFDTAAIQAALGSGALSTARLELHVEFNAQNWGGGRTVDAHRLTNDWTELGATWSCANDTDPTNQLPDCSAPWGGSSFAPAPSATVLHTDTLMNQWVAFDVTADVAAFLAGTAPNYGWVIKKTEEQLNGHVQYTAREGTAGFAPRLVLSTGGAAPTATATLADTATATATGTATAAPPPTDTATPAATATASATAIGTSSATATDSPVPPTATATATASATLTVTPTPTPVPPGGLVGEVFDDGSAQPLAGVEVWVDGALGAVSDAGGRYAVPALAAGGRSLWLTRSDYTRSRRAVEVASDAAVRVRDARLTALAAAAEVGTAGRVLTVAPPAVPPLAPGQAAPIELVVAANTVPDGTAARCTALGPQGLIAPVPLGWSVLLGVDLQAEPPPGTATATLRVPLALLAAAAGAPVVAARWDDTGEQWLAAAASVIGNAVEVAEVPFPSPVAGQPSVSTQVALLVADSLPAAPPTPVVGQVLEGVSASLAVADSAAVRADPPVIVSGTGAGAAVLARVEAPAPVPSGTAARGASARDLRPPRRPPGARRAHPPGPRWVSVLAKCERHAAQPGCARRRVRPGPEPHLWLRGATRGARAGRRRPTGSRQRARPGRRRGR